MNRKKKRVSSEVAHTTAVTVEGYLVPHYSVTRLRSCTANTGCVQQNVYRFISRGSWAACLGMYESVVLLNLKLCNTQSCLTSNISQISYDLLRVRQRVRVMWSVYKGIVILSLYMEFETWEGGKKVLSNTLDWGYGSEPGLAS